MDVLAKVRNVCGILSLPIRWYSAAIDRLLRPLGALADHSLGPPAEALTLWWDERHPPDYRKRVAGLSPDKAKEIFLKALSQCDVYWLVEAESNDPSLDVLAPELRSLFSRYREIGAEHVWFSREMMILKPPKPGLDWIGEVWGGALPLLVRHNQEQIYYWDPSDGPLGDDFESALTPSTYPTIYHWLLGAVLDEELADVEGGDEVRVS